MINVDKKNEELSETINDICTFVNNNGVNQYDKRGDIRE